MAAGQRDRRTIEGGSEIDHLAIDGGGDGSAEGPGPGIGGAGDGACLNRLVEAEGGGANGQGDYAVGGFHKVRWKINFKVAGNQANFFIFWDFET